MRPLIPRHYYYDAQVYAEEQQTLFGGLWHLAGFTRDLKNSNDYITTEAGGTSVVVQNFDGELRAFANVCSHRFARIRGDAKGTGPLRCPYHGWIYNKEGLPYSIPSRPRFDDLTPDVVKGLGLRAYAVETCGTLVFVRREAEGETLRDFLAGSHDSLASMSRAFGELVYNNDMVFKANWKVCVENTLEAYHVGFVHENTFKILGTSGMDFRFDGRHSTWLTEVEPATQQRMAKVGKLGKMPLPLRGYVHQLVFPSVTVSTVCGTAFGVQLLRPLSPTQTLLTGLVFLSKLGAGESVNATVTEMLGPSAAEFTLDVAHEDRAVCEAVQLGVPHTSQPGMLSDEEERVLKFQIAYMEAMGAWTSTSRSPASPEA